jgi:hypothetical protein
MNISEIESLFEAIENNNLSKVEELIKSGLDVNLVDKSIFLGKEVRDIERTKQRNPLELATFLRRSEIAKYLMSQGGVIRSDKMLKLGL